MARYAVVDLDDADTLAHLAHLARQRAASGRVHRQPDTRISDLAHVPALGAFRDDTRPALPAWPGPVPPGDLYTVARTMGHPPWPLDVIARALLAAAVESGTDLDDAKAAVRAGLRDARKAAA